MTPPIHVPRCGESSGYRAGCRCDPCRRWRKGNDVAHERRGGVRTTVPAGPTRERVAWLQALGMNLEAIAAASGLSESCVGTLTRPTTVRVRRTTEAAIMAVQPATPVGVSRRLRALARIGWSPYRLAPMLGTTPTAVWSMQTPGHHHPRVIARVAELYARLEHRPPTPDTEQDRRGILRTRNRAAGLGWAPPAAWDDDTLDDPTATPAEGWHRPRQRPSADTVEDAADLLAVGEHVDTIAARLGMTLDAIAAACHREGRADLARPFAVAARRERAA